MSWIIALSFVCAICAALGWTIDGVRKLTKYQGMAWTRGVAVAHREALDANNIVFYTEFEYEVRGQRYRMIDYIAFGLTCYRLGDQVWMRYDPDDCRRAYVWRTWPAIFILVSAAAMLVVIGALLARPWPLD